MESVVKLYEEDHIGVIVMEDRESKNTFTHKFITELKDIFKTIQHDSKLKVILVHGFENYFCCGGTKDELIWLYEGIGRGDAKFTELQFHDIFLQCDIPVISAMQGHAIGGGLAMGCFADIIVMGEQCIYSANFMKYGFTPGMGATYIVRKKFGDLLGNEMLFSARNYFGSELKARGAPMKIVKKNEVIKTAMGIARDLADKTILSLKVLKKHLSDTYRRELPGEIEKELEMHQLTFTQPEVRERIESHFGN